MTEKRLSVIHVSDTHGRFLQLPDTPEDAPIVCTGDFFPSAPLQRIFGRWYWQGKVTEIDFQQKWLVDNMPQMLDWIGDRKFVWVSGNHDFINPCDDLKRMGLDAIDMDGYGRSLFGLRWFGMPHVESTVEAFSYCGKPWLLERIVLDGFFEQGGLDVLLLHTPIKDILDIDKDGSSWGSVGVFEALSAQKKLPSYVLHGHVHKPGAMSVFGMEVCNSATIAKRIDMVFSG